MCSPISMNWIQFLSACLQMHSLEDRMNIWPRKSAENWPESFSSTFISVDFSDRAAWLYARVRVFACLNACVCNYKDFEWFLYYISNPTPLRGWQLQFSVPQRTVCVCANISCATRLVTTVADTALRFMLCFPGRFSVKYTSWSWFGRIFG